MNIERGEIWVLDKTRLIRKLGKLKPEIINQLESIVLFTLGYQVR